MRTPRDGYSRDPNRTVAPGYVTPDMRSSHSQIQRLEQIRNELEIQRRLMHVIKKENLRVHMLTQGLPEQKGAHGSEQADQDPQTKPESKKKEPVPAFASIEDGVDFSWIHQPFHSTNELTTEVEKESNQDSANVPGLVLIMTPILPGEQSENSEKTAGNLANVELKNPKIVDMIPTKVNPPLFTTSIPKNAFLMKETNVDESDSEDSDDESFTMSVISDSDCSVAY